MARDGGTSSSGNRNLAATLFDVLQYSSHGSWRISLVEHNKEIEWKGSHLMVMKQDYTNGGMIRN